MALVADAKLEAYSSHLEVHADVSGVSSDGSVAWAASGNELRLVDSRSGELLALWRFCTNDGGAAEVRSRYTRIRNDRVWDRGVDER